MGKLTNYHTARRAALLREHTFSPLAARSRVLHESKNPSFSVAESARKQQRESAAARKT